MAVARGNAPGINVPEDANSIPVFTAAKTWSSTDGSVNCAIAAPKDRDRIYVVYSAD